jgi:hypothetical protein
VPSQTLDHAIPSLVRKLQDKKVVVFHCALSQQRGPGAALRYLRERKRLLGSGSGSGRERGIGEALKRSAEERRSASGEKEDDEWVDEDGAQDGNGNGEQKVYVLDRGFVGWQERFGEDVRLTQNYSKELWSEGYWM